MDDEDYMDDSVEEKYVLVVRTDCATNIRRQETILTDGEMGCSSGPAYREFDRFGRLLVERWAMDGLEQRDDDLPSETVWEPDHNQITYQSYKFEGQFSRTNGQPARIWFSEVSGKVVKEEFWAHGKLHRDQLPAICEYSDCSGELIGGQYYEHGQKLRNQDFVPNFTNG